LEDINKNTIFGFTKLSNLPHGGSGIKVYKCKPYMSDCNESKRGFSLKEAAELTVYNKYMKALNLEKLRYCFEYEICTGGCPMVELLLEIYEN